MTELRWAITRVALCAALAMASTTGRPATADTVDSTISATPPAYAALVAQVEPAPLVLAVRIRKVAQVEPARAGDVPPGQARVYVEAQGVAALRGALPASPVVSYLADVPLDARGKLPPLAKREVLLFARPVADHPDMLQLVAPDAQLPWDPAMATRVRAVLDALAAPDAPGRITGVREAIYVPGTLEGEGETQIFLATPANTPAAVTVVHRPGEPASWSASFSEVVDASGKPPAHDTLAWYRLACALPPSLPPATNVSATAADQAQAAADYRLVKDDLGSCRP